MSTMSFVDNREQHEKIQQLIQSIAIKANLPSICFDVLTCNMAHIGPKDSH
jgi:hypothetical protein